MDITAKILEFLVEHNAAIAPGTLAKKFIISQSKTNKILEDLVKQGKIDIVKIGSHDFYKVK
jgi:DNA-binding IclR family transcriptional regulator